MTQTLGQAGGKRRLTDK